MGMHYKRGKVWWVRYSIDGHQVRESTGTEKEAEAKRFLKLREGRVATGAPILPRTDRIRYDEIADDLRRHYEVTGDRSLKDVDTRLKPLARFFAGRRVAAITGALCQEYVQTRQAQGRANGTINRELSLLITMLKRAHKHDKVMRLPAIDSLKEAAPRAGFFEACDYRAVSAQLRPDLQAVVAIEYTFGWRTQEVLGLERRQLDLEAGTLRLDPGTTKNDEGRVVHLTPDVAAHLSAQVERVKSLERALRKIIPFLFPHLSGPHKGKRICDFRKAWMSACERAGLTGMLRHDFRRTAVRSMEAAGVPRSVAMRITGHKSESIYTRYAIVCEKDSKEATRRLVEHAAREISTISSTVAPLAREARS